MRQGVNVPKTKQSATGLNRAANRSTATLLVNSAAKARGNVSVTFGDVSVVVGRPSQQMVEQGVRASAKAIDRLSKRLAVPGVTIADADKLPMFSADPTDPTRVVRQWNGKSEVGQFVKGEFRAIKGRIAA
jgi:hypothetical protein